MMNSKLISLAEDKRTKCFPEFVELIKKISEENFRFIKNKDTIKKEADSHQIHTNNHNQDSDKSDYESDASYDDVHDDDEWSKCCVIHNVPTHFSHRCKTFQKMSPEERMNIITEKSACTQCLCLHPWVGPNGECGILKDLPHLRCGKSSCEGRIHNYMLCVIPKDVNKESMTSAEAFMTYAGNQEEDSDGDKETDEEVEEQEHNLYEHAYMNFE